jgi:HEAT repeat protein
MLTRTLPPVLCLLLVGAASGQASFAPPAPGPDWYGDWMMWWSTNREEFVCRTDPATASRPADVPGVELVSTEDCRKRVVPVLTKALKDGEKQVREAAALALGMCGDATDLDAMKPLLGDRDRAVAEAAVIGVGMLGAVDGEAALVKLMADPATVEKKRGLAALALGLSGGDGAKKALLEGLGSDKSEKFEGCRAIGAGLWSGGDLKDANPERCAQAAAAVQKGLKGQDKRRKLVSFGAAAFSKSRDPSAKAYVLASLQDTRFDVRAAAAIAAGRVVRAGDQQGTRAVIQALAGEAHILPVRFLIISLGRIGGPEAIGAVTKEYNSGDKTRRAFAALALGIAGAAEVAPKLRQDLAGPTEDRVKGALAIALGLLRDPDAFAQISKICQGKPNDELLSYCVWFFALSQNREGSKVLEKVLAGSRVAATQEAAATALGAIGAVESLEFLTGLLQKSPLESARKAAAIGLGRMRDQRGVDALVKAARGDGSPVVRAAAVAALGTVARRTNLPPFARVAIDAYYGLQNEAIDDVATWAGSLMKTTEEGGNQETK